jgi:hypothetical protein
MVLNTKGFEFLEVEQVDDRLGDWAGLRGLGYW